MMLVVADTTQPAAALGPAAVTAAAAPAAYLCR